jgi:hypothetical protein
MDSTPLLTLLTNGWDRRIVQQLPPTVAERQRVARTPPHYSGSSPFRSLTRYPSEIASGFMSIPGQKVDLRVRTYIFICSCIFLWDLQVEMD